MKRFALIALALLVAMIPMVVSAEATPVPEGESVEEIWSATVLRTDIVSLLVQIEAIDPENEAGYPWDMPEPEQEAPEETPATEQAPDTAHSLSTQEDDGDILGVQLVNIAADAPIWQRTQDGFEEADAAQIAEGDVLTLRVLDGEALEIVIEETAPAAEGADALKG